MAKSVGCVGLLVLLGCGVRAPERVGLVAGVRLERTAVIAPGVYFLPAPADPNLAVITVHGQDLNLDFSGVILMGAPQGAAPDEYQGIAVRIDGGRGITIRNLTARGYKVALLASDVESLHLVNCDFSYNYRPRLKSTAEREDLSDWLSFHHNDNDEWLRYGAAIYLRGCKNSQIERCTVTGGQNGLLMTRCDDATIWNNNFSFNSGVGLGMYRSNRNTVVHNRLDWCIRGYSHGVYNRGQDSAGILVYEQSCNNVFAYNSATHSGDGLFLWAGQTTMDSGQGGCNDNIIAFNDFSHASNNGIEVTFSRNTIVGNRLEECDYGIWGGYSFETHIEANRFKNNRVGIAIEHGQDNIIINNDFSGDRTGIRLWQNPQENPNWGYPKHRDTRSQNYIIADNRFTEVAKPLDIAHTANVRTDSTAARPIEHRLREMVPPMTQGMDAMLGSGQPRGREYILMGEWGPYDFRSPRIRVIERLPDGRRRLEVLGPPGQWRIVRKSGVTAVSSDEGLVPAQILVVAREGQAIALELQYIGAEGRSVFGEPIPAGKVHRFTFSE